MKTFESINNSFPKNIEELEELISNYLNKLNIEFERIDLKEGMVKYTIELSIKDITIFLYDGGLIAYNEIEHDPDGETNVTMCRNMDEFTNDLAKSFGIDTHKSILKINQ